MSSNESYEPISQSQNRRDLEYNNLNSEWNTRKTVVTIIRSVLVLGALIGVFLNSILGFALPEGNIKCIVDKSHTGTTGVNQSLIENTKLRNALLIVSSLLMDLAFLTRIVIYVWKSKSWRFVGTILMFYFIRLIAQLIFLVKPDDGYAWENPGFPSLIVSYQKENAFYFNSQLGLILICAIEFIKEKYYVFFSLSMLFIIFHTLMLIFLRGAYIIDIISSIIVAHFCHLVMDEFIIQHIDNNPTLGFKRYQRPPVRRLREERQNSEREILRNERGSNKNTIEEEVKEAHE